MRQKVVIRAIVSQRDKILLLRRSGGRSSITGMYELPGGSLHAGEQPVDSLKRSLQIHAGIYPETARLEEVVSFFDPDRPELQYLFILYRVDLGDQPARISLDSEYDHYVWRKLSKIQQNSITNSTAKLLNLSIGSSIDRDLVLDGSTIDDKNTTFVIYSDGGSRGNPGPSAAAFFIMDSDENVVAKGGEFLGQSNSGMAEYAAVELALEKALELNINRIEFRSDSLMVVNQLNGLFPVKNKEFRPVHDRIIRLANQFNRIKFRHVHREYNRLADSLVNKVLDENRN